MKDSTMKDEIMDEPVASVTETPSEPKTDNVASLPTAAAESKEDAANCVASEQADTSTPVIGETIPAPALEPQPEAAPSASDKTASVPTASLAPELMAIAEKIRELGEAFEAKLRWDASKQEVINRQHAELEAFRDNAMEKGTDRIAQDIMAEIDSAGKLVAYYTTAQYPEGDFAKLHGDFLKLLRILGGFQDGLRDLLEKYGFESWRAEPGTRFDPKRQRALKTTPTEQQELDGTIRESMRYGFEKAGRIVRPEMIDLYKFKAAQPAASTTTSQPAHPPQNSQPPPQPSSPNS